MLSQMDPFYLTAFVLLGMVVVGGLLLQALAIVRQRKSFLGFGLKMAALAGLFAFLPKVEQNVVPYIVAFLLSALFSLACATLARRVLLR
jgi:hypothetical protein